MNNAASDIDWTLLRAFVAVAESGSLSAAARRLGLSQPTVGRQIQALEESVGVSLFRRTARGMTPTESARPMLEPAQAMAAAAARLHLAADASADITGTVRITSSVFVAHYLLPPIISKLRASEPSIDIELVASDASENLLFREADIAIRMYRPQQLEIVTRQIGTIGFGAFAATTYLRRRGIPQSPQELIEHDLVGFDRDETIIRAMREGGWQVTRDNFQVRCDQQSVYWQLVCAGCGIGFSQRRVGEHEPLVQAVLPDFPIGEITMWLAAHPRVLHTARVSQVWEKLATALAQVVD